MTPAGIISLCCVERCWPTTRRAQRSETSSSSFTWLTAWRLREGLKTFCCATLRVLKELFKDLFAAHEIRDGFPKPGVLLLHVLKPLGLINLEAAILLTPSVVSLFGHANRLSHYANAFALAQSQLDFS